MRSRLLVGTLLAATVLAGCSVGLRTANAPSAACEMALIGGSLERHPLTGLGISTQGEEVTPVQWPFGYSARLELGAMVLVDETGAAVAREHDRVEVGGGGGADGMWFACGPARYISNEGG